MFLIRWFNSAIRCPLVAIVLAALSGSVHAETWWNKEWPARRQITIDTTANGTAVADVIGKAVVLIRLHDGTYQFALGKEDGSDIRFVAADDKTLLPHHIERYDPVLNEAFVWVSIPEVKPSAQTTLWLYYGNPAAQSTHDPKGTYDAETVLVYHFAETGAPPSDSSAGGNKAENAGTGIAGSLISGGLRLTGQGVVRIPASPTLAWSEGGSLTWSAWIKPATLGEREILFSRTDEARSFIIGTSSGSPFVEVNGQRTAAGPPLAVNTWRHLAVVAEGGKITLLLDGETYSTLEASLPALNSPAVLGGLDKGAAGEGQGFSGEIDELQIARAVRPVGSMRLAALTQSGDAKSAKLLVFGNEQGGAASHNATLEHVMLFKDIASNMMFDGWIAVGVCIIMIVFGWTVAVRKFFYLNTVQQGSDAFLKQWAQVSSDLTALDHQDQESVRSMGGNVDKKTLRNLHRSPLYHLYHIGSEEIRHRLVSGRTQGLSARSIQAIRASLESGLVRENQRMNKGLILLTISIAGGPYVGLLGTVVGVMITFALIAKTGEVEVNSIAPGIASALLATVAGLVVAIPALFIYSYLNGRIKELLAEMQVFIDEFIAKMAEFYPTPSDMVVAASMREAAVIQRSGEPHATGSGNHAS